VAFDDKAMETYNYGTDPKIGVESPAARIGSSELWWVL